MRNSLSTHRIHAKGPLYTYIYIGRIRIWCVCLSIDKHQKERKINQNLTNVWRNFILITIDVNALCVLLFVWIWKQEKEDDSVLWERQLHYIRMEMTSMHKYIVVSYTCSRSDNSDVVVYDWKEDQRLLRLNIAMLIAFFVVNNKCGYHSKREECNCL